MDPETKKLLEKTFDLAEENNKILRSIKRGQRLASFMRLVYWAVLIGAGVWSFYLLEPFIDQVKGMFDASSEAINQIKGRGETMPR